MEINRRLARNLGNRRGFTLVEVLVATCCLVVALAGVAQVYAAAAQTLRRAHEITRSTILAQDKMEELVARAANGADLDESPPGALTADIDGSFDLVAGFVRRWSIAPLPAAPSAALVLQVVVVTAEHRNSSPAAQSSTGARLVTVRRKTP